MTRLAHTFQTLQARGERALVPFVTCGDPDLATTRQLILAYIEAGADVMEIGIPFTDPLADGPTIQRASERALAGGVSMDDALALIADLRPHTDVPLVPMTYVNPVYTMGYRQFAGRCREAGVDGVIISDLPPDEADEWVAAAGAEGVGTVFLAAPTSDAGRLAQVGAATTGFIYAVARMGVTGARSDVPPEISDLVDRIHAVSKLPVCAGFGFSTPDQIAATCRGSKVDGIVVASALIDLLEKTPGTREQKVAAAAAAVKAMKQATLPSSGHNSTTTPPP